ncbi:transcriptional regulator BetI [Shinella sp. AETb1-6]|jgi:transcriptional repressor BetI|uniref:Transcriptional regulator BetI n=1 Tax=Shinella sumterensis TaxID=1967501 RepID=A0AA50HJ73_9HYPH|nr:MULTISPECIES: transcriptional regulator BetI [Shinella]MCD1266778.1 transcriptional regulator BetI [Shinella sumterensis]MXN54061.1 transcriptional regulator BetI [Shinella sp. AETb1-6]TFE95336.1 transcriptional regulator BetI [Shinella sumterensis]WLR99326.1 transcriptional regulator BetI [Shinella sumterensis]WLS11603.1 transcriptional regulator BetI [Shinella sumterensis]
MQQKPKRPRTRIEDIRRVELIDAAHRIFLKEGLRGLTSTKICSEAGLSQGILTYYFKDKEEVLFEMVRMNNRILANEIVLNLRRAHSGWERLMALIDGNFPAQRFDKQAASAWVSLYAEASHNERYARLLRPYYRRLRSNVSSILRPYLEQDKIDHFNLGFAAMIDGLWLRRGHADIDLSLAQAKSVLIDYVEKALPHEVIRLLSEPN